MKALILVLMLFCSTSGTPCGGDDCDDWTRSDMMGDLEGQMWKVMRCHSENTIIDVEVDDIDPDGKRWDFDGTYKGKKSSGTTYKGEFRGEFVLETNLYGECKLKIKNAFFDRVLYSGTLYGCY